MTDLALVGARVLDPAGDLDGPADIAITGGRISGVGGIGVSVATLDASGLVLVPGLVDLHTHLYEGVSHYGINPDTACLDRGVTTAVDAGSSGAQTFPGFRRYILEPAQTRIFAFLNVAVQGMISALVGELEDRRWGSVSETVARAREHTDVIVGVKVRLGYQMAGPDPEPAFQLARQAADELELPLMVHILDMGRPLAWLLSRLGEGDVVTHCFHGGDGGILGADGRVRPEASEARRRGVLFDIGHGTGSFAYRVGKAALAQGFPPDSVSSDLHAHSIGGPVFDHATTLSKLMHCGMSLGEVVRAATTGPARAIRRGEVVGSLEPGREADLTGFELREGEWKLADGAGQSEVIGRLLTPRLVVRSGRARLLEPVSPGAAGSSPAPP